jgi:hypothetical protein
MRAAALLAALVVIAACSADDGVATAASYSDLAATICPRLWDWQREVGATINAMSTAAIAEPNPVARQALYLDTFAELDAKLDDLQETITELPPTAHTAAMQDEVRTGIAAAHREIVDLAAAVEATAPVDEPDGRMRVPSFFGELEKVIDVVKPEIAGYRDAELTTAFAALPACQFGVKDVDDGVPRSNE